MAYRPFIVDAALLQELGERLIGRPDIAVAELIKNAYDADAPICEVEIGDDRIIVADNGEGMDNNAFNKYYLRLGTQHKRKARVSRRLQRPLTGAKGVGRLATQFLGWKLRIETCSEGRDSDVVVASIDWSKIRSGKELKTFAVNVETGRPSTIKRFPDNCSHGTRIIIEDLKVSIDQNSVKFLGSEVWSLRSPFGRFGQIGPEMYRDDPDNFEICFRAHDDELEASFESVLRDLVERVWRARITGRISDGRTSGVGEVEIEFTEGYPTNAPVEHFADRIQLSDLRPIGPLGVSTAKFEKPLIGETEFTIYVYRLERKQNAKVPLSKLRDYLSRFGNVSIYDAGFRLPYYGINSDWLQIGADHSRRLSISSLLPSKWGIEARYMLDLPDPRRLFGIVNINTAKESWAAVNNVNETGSVNPGNWLEIQPGRDRLHDNDAYQQLQAFVRYSLDLYANRFRARSLRAAEATADRETTHRKYRRLTQMLAEYRDIIPDDVYNEAKRAEAAAKNQEHQFTQRVSTIAPLAAAGMAALAMTHELNREKQSLDSVRRDLQNIARLHDLSDVVQATEKLDRFFRRIRSLQGLFSPLLSEDDRERRSRLRVEPVVRHVAEGMEPLTPGMFIAIHVNDEMRFPAAPMTAWNAILQNLITNAWNACLATREARVEIKGFETDHNGILKISDTGVGIDLADTTRMFDAFERGLNVSREHKPVMLGGTGMGLAIVRMLAETYKTDVAFVEPEPDYSTTFRMTWRN